MTQLTTFAASQPYFRVCRRRGGQWDQEDFRSFKDAKKRCIEEWIAGVDADGGEPLCYVKHLPTEEAVFSPVSNHRMPEINRKLAAAEKLWAFYRSEFASVKDGYWPDMKPLWDECMALWGEPKS